MTPQNQNTATYDVCVVGSGAAGGVVAMQLAQKGASVVVLEAGKWVDPAKDFFSHTMPYELPKNGRGWDPRAHLTVDRTKEPFTKAGDYQRFDHFLSKVVGGKTLLWAGLSWRNSTYDFAAWPVKYEELAPHYDRMERLMGVTGNYDHHPNVPDGIFLKPLKWSCAAYEIQKGCNKLDAKRFKMITARKAILTEKTGSNRPACHYCGHCMRGCDVDAKYTSANTALPAALKTGKCKLILYANAAEVMMSKDGSRAEGVRYFDARTRQSQEVRARYVVLACGPIESARLLLLSKSQHVPNGLANSSGLVGRNLISHTSSSVQGYLKTMYGSDIARLGNDDGTESSHAYIASFYYDKPHPDFPKGYHIIVDSGSRAGIGNPGFVQNIGGFGVDLKREARHRYPGLLSMYSQNGMIASPEKYMELDPEVKDIYGLAVPKIHFSLTSEDRAIHKDAIEKISSIIEASGGVVTGTSPNPGVDSVHWVGTCKMGNDPKTSVLTPYLQSHDVQNLYVADGSGFIDFSEKNPTLTVMALASRCADHLHEQLRRS
ncbi:MAG: GMC family oxidoreductase [Acidobacteria bacterium]|nr:GMC family oxidoreductase [Acidobacteriota bacterium]MBI3425689.1 GMC family oxidoreductase [Acidobacteriota bacterium]